MREPKWRRVGNSPDYRFSLANERTFLAWIRTAMALLAGAIAIDQLTPDIAPSNVRIAVCVLLALAGGAVAIEAYRRWRAHEIAMRTGAELPHSWLLIALTVALTLAAVVFGVLFLVMQR